MAPHSPAFAPSSPLRARAARAPPAHAAPRCTAAVPPPKRPRRVTRRAALAASLAAAAAAAAPHAARAIELYKTGTTRYIPQGRPKPTGPAPTFDARRATFTVTTNTIGDAPTTLEVQEVTVGEGLGVAARGSLAVAVWRILLADGNVVEESDAEMFRVGVAQVYPGLDGVVVGMRPGGVRQCRGPAQAFFSDITTGERSLVPSDATVFATVELRQLDPFGRPQ
jgi:hypothetical protein